MSSSIIDVRKSMEIRKRRVINGICVILVLRSAHGQQLTSNGRFAPPGNNAVFPQRLTWASTTVYVPFQGSGNVTVSMSQVPQTGTSQLELRIDGKLLESATTNSTEPVNVSIPVLGSGSHQLAITKITEAAFGEVYLEGVYLSGPSFSQAKTPVVNRRMEIIGASVVNGYGNMGLTVNCAGSYAYQVEDSVLAFGPLVANNFGARFAQIAWSGAGITTPGGVGGPTIPQLYNRTLPANASSQWDFSSFVPEVVLVEAGDNDFNSGSAPANWSAAYKDFLRQIRGNAPNAQIVVLGLPDNVVSSLGPLQAAHAFHGNATAAINDLKSSGFRNLYFLSLPSSVQQGPTGCAGHPSADTHARIANVVQDFVGNITGWMPISTEAGYGSFVFNN